MLLIGLRMLCQQSIQEVMYSEAEDNLFSSYEEDEHNASNFFLAVVGQSRLGMQL